MAKGHDSKNKKKLTKKEQKALAHAKLMAGKKGGIVSESNVIDLNAHRKEQELKKAA